MSTPFIAEIRIVSFDYAPSGWAACNGQVLPINQNQALFSLLGTTYGGNGQTTFALPDLQGRTPIHPSGSFVLGQAGGEATHTLISPEMPQHRHIPVASSATADQVSPTNDFWANAGVNTYSSNAPNAAMAPQATGSTGGSQPHQNYSPYLALNFIIALNGIFPSRN